MPSKHEEGFNGPDATLEEPWNTAENEAARSNNNETRGLQSLEQGNCS